MIDAFTKRIKITNDTKGLLVLFKDLVGEAADAVKVSDDMGVIFWIPKSWIIKHHYRRTQYAVIINLAYEKDFYNSYTSHTKDHKEKRSIENAKYSLNRVTKLERQIRQPHFKQKYMTTAERKLKVKQLRKEHQPYFDSAGIPNAAFIPKMAYRPKGKDTMHVSFFPSELKKQEDLYTEFVSIDYICEDPKRTLYLFKHNPQWEEVYDIHESSTGFKRYLVPVTDLKTINDVNTRKPAFFNAELLEDPDDNQKDVFKALSTIAKELDRIATILDKKLK